MKALKRLEKLFAPGPGKDRKYFLVIPVNRLRLLASWWPDIQITQMNAKEQHQAKEMCKYDKIEHGRIMTETRFCLEIHLKRFPKDASTMSSIYEYVQQTVRDRNLPVSMADISVQNFTYYLRLDPPYEGVGQDTQLHFTRLGVMPGVFRRLMADGAFPNEEIYRRQQLMQRSLELKEEKESLAKSFLILDRVLSENLENLGSEPFHDKEFIEKVKLLGGGRMLSSFEDIRNFLLRSAEYDIQKGYEMESARP